MRLVKSALMAKHLSISLHRVYKELWPPLVAVYIASEKMAWQHRYRWQHWLGCSGFHLSLLNRE
jgi:hypothetical protein